MKKVAVATLGAVKAIRRSILWLSSGRVDYLPFDAVLVRSASSTVHALAAILRLLTDSFPPCVSEREAKTLDSEHVVARRLRELTAA